MNPIKKLEIHQVGLDPSDFEAWRKSVFAVVLATKSGERFAGASLAYDRGTIDLEILKDSESPDDIAAVCPMTTFLGTNFMVPITKGQVYTYLDAWNAAGRPAVYQWPQAVAGHPENPVVIALNDPCRSVSPRETMTTAARARMIADGRYTDWKPYRRSVEAAFATMEANMTESMRQELADTPEYLRAVSTGDLLGMLNQVKMKAICGHRILSDVIHDAIANVINPRGMHKQQEEEPDADYALRFRRIVNAAHGLRALSRSDLTEQSCIEGYLSGLRSAFATIKLTWQNAGFFTSLSDAMKRVKITGQSMIKNDTVASAPSALTSPAPADPESIKRKADTIESPKQARFRSFRRSYPSSPIFHPSAGAHSGHVLMTSNDEQEELEEEVFTTEQVQQIVRDSVFATQNSFFQSPALQSAYPPSHHQQHVLATQNAFNYGQQPWTEPQAYHSQAYHQQYGQPYGHNPAIFLASPGARAGAYHTMPKATLVCRYFAANQPCPYGEACRFLHAQPVPRDPYQNNTSQGSGATSIHNAVPSTASPSPRTNPFAARPSN